MGKKWDDATAVEKILSLYTMLLVSHNSLSLTKLAERLECSKQTVSRLINQIEKSHYGKIQRTLNGREAFYKLDKPSQKSVLSINAKDLQQLALCREFLLHILPDNMQKQLQESINQAAKYCGQEEPLSGIGGSLCKGIINYSKYENWINKIYRAIIENRVCKVTYKAKRYKQEKIFSFAPKRFVSYHESIYTLGYRITDAGAVKIIHENPLSLAIHRITGCELERRKAFKVPEIPVDNNALGIIKETPFEIEVYFSSQVSTYAGERIWSYSQEISENEDGSIIIRLKVNNSQEAIAWILSFGSHAKLISPNSLKEQLKETVDKLYAIYN